MSRLATRLPEHLSAIALTEGAVRVCLVITRQDDPVAGRLVVLSRSGFAASYLGALLDSDGGVVDWLEIWVQSPDLLEAAPLIVRGSACNGVLDRAWRGWVDAIEQSDPGSLVRVGWERSSPGPIVLDLDAGEAIRPHIEGRALALCTDDASLGSAGLDAYGTTLARYLWSPDDPGRFVRVGAFGRDSDATVDLSTVLGSAVRWTEFNSGAGMMLARRLAPMRLEDYLACVGGAPWEGICHGVSRVSLGEEAGGAARFRRHEEVFLYRHGRWGGLVEALYLKLRVLLLGVRDVAALVERTGRPLLDLSLESFGVYLHPTAEGLPALWAARPALREPGSAVELPVRFSDAKYFETAREASVGSFAPPLGARGLSGSGTLRIRSVQSAGRGADEGKLSFEATLATQDHLTLGEGDLVRLTVSLRDRRVELFATPMTLAGGDRGRADGEVRLRGVPERVEDDVREALREAEGRPLAQVRYETMSLQSSPVDLYALAVLGIRALLVDDRTTLAVALDEVLSLARQVAREHDGQTPLVARIARIMGGDAHWMEALGPHRLTAGGLTPEEALQAIPRDLWLEVLGVLVTMLPGVGADSTARSFGDAPSSAPHAVFEPCERALSLLLERARSLMMVDWASNREVSGVIRRYLADEVLGGPKSNGKRETRR